MNSKRYILLLAFVAGFATAGEAFAQQHPERRHIRSGNRDYEALDYSGAENKYRGALVENPLSFEAGLNLGDALYKQERYEEAASVLETLSRNPGLSEDQLARLHYNLGNTQFQQQKLKESLESYKKSLINNPHDLQAKFNLAYVQKMLDDQQQDDQRDENDDQQDNSNQDNDQNQDNKSDQQDPDQQDQQGDREDEPRDQENDQQEQPREAAISPEDAEKMLEAIQSQEDKTREKMDEKKKAVAPPSGKNW